MPIYEYVCKKCNAKFEILHRSSDNTKTACPECKEEDIERVLSIFGFSSGDKFMSSGSKVSCSTCTSKKCDTCG